MTVATEADLLKQRLLDAEQRAAAGMLPPQLQHLSERHLQQLVKLVVAMRAAGIDEALVRHSVRQIIDSYEHELVEALMRLAKEPK